MEVKKLSKDGAKGVLKSAKKVRTPFKLDFSGDKRSCKRRFESLSGSFCEFSIQFAKLPDTRAAQFGMEGKGLRGWDQR